MEHSDNSVVDDENVEIDNDIGQMSSTAGSEVNTDCGDKSVVMDCSDGDTEDSELDQNSEDVEKKESCMDISFNVRSFGYRECKVFLVIGFVVILRVKDIIMYIMFLVIGFTRYIWRGRRRK